MRSSSVFSAAIVGLVALVAALPTSQGRSDIDVADAFKRETNDIDVADAFKRDDSGIDVADAFKRDSNDIDVADAF